MTPQALASLKAVCAGAEEKQEAGHRYVYLPQLKVPVGGVVKVLDALLAITGESGYPTRLFLAEQITERQTIGDKPANWSQHSVLGRSWWTWSWRDVPVTLPEVQILLSHLRALQ